MQKNNVNEKEVDSNIIKNIVTARDVAKIINQVTNDSSVKIIDYHLSDYSENKLGLFGSHKKLKIKFQKIKASSPEVIECFVKFPSNECEALTEYIKEVEMFEKELFFYQTVAPLLTKNYKGEKWLPVFYLSVNDTLIMENLTLQDYKPCSKLFEDPVLLKSALAALARFHSCSIIAGDELKCNSEGLIMLDGKHSKYLKELAFTKEMIRPMMWRFACLKIVTTVAQRLGFDINKIYKAFENVYDILKPSKIYQNVIGHGDIWGNNFMFDDTKPFPKCVLVDFQFYRYGPIALDLLMFLYTNTARAFRQENEKELLTFYHSVLEETIKSNDPKKSLKIPTLKEILNSYKDLKLFGAVVASMWLPLILLDPKITVDYIVDSEKYLEFTFKDRTDIVLEYMKKDKSYKNRIEDTIIELMEIIEQT